METTGDLWAIGYEDPERAGQVRDEVIRLGWDKAYRFLEGIAVVVRHLGRLAKFDKGLIIGQAK